MVDPPHQPPFDIPLLSAEEMTQERRSPVTRHEAGPLTFEGQTYMRPSADGGVEYGWEGTMSVPVLIGEQLFEQEDGQWMAPPFGKPVLGKRAGVLMPNGDILVTGTVELKDPEP